jgi:V8-like Glu-specific endopeptidase
MNHSAQPTFLIKRLFAGLTTVMVSGNVGADALSTDQIRGLSHQELCRYHFEDSAESAEIDTEIRKRSLDCSALSQDGDGYDYSPDAIENTSGDSTDLSSVEHSWLKTMDPEELAHLQAEVQKEADHLQQRTWAGEGRESFRTATASPSPRPFYPPSGVVRISTGKAVGSGFYAKDRLIVTNAHVVGDTTNIAISFSSQTPFLGQVVFRDEDLDFAIIETTTSGTPLPIRRGPVTLGEHIIAMGFPQGRQVMASSTGTVMDVVDCCIAHDALVAGGSSGGPLLDAHYEVLGLNTLLSKKPGDKAKDTDRAITVRMDFILDILRSEQTKASRAE